jgi:hypothetical protein
MARGNPLITHPDVIEFAGDYRLSNIVIHNHKGEGFEPSEQGVDIKNLVQEFNLYEGIYKTAMTGSVVVVDSINLIGRLPIQGTERISFKLTTPGTTDGMIDCSERSGHPMHIYKLTNKQQVSEGTQIYTLHFASREFLRNLRTKVSQSFSGRYDEMVRSIFEDKDYLDSRKRLFVEKTRNQDQVVIPNLSPFSAIEMMSRRSLADDKNGAGFHFFETTKGFHFRSWESMCVTKNKKPRDAVQVFRYMAQNITDPNLLPEKGQTKANKIVHDYTSVESYKFLNNFHDVAANTALGTYGHRVITHNIYNKSYKEDDYHYHKSFADTQHTDKRYNNFAIVDSPIDWDTTDDTPPKNKGVSDYPQARVSVQSSTRFAHGEDTGNFGVDIEQDGIIEGERTAQENQVHAGTKLQLTVKGQSYLQSGDVIEFQIRSVDADNTDGEFDPQFAGRYIITKIRHRVTDSDYVQVLECSKDSVFRPYSKSFDNTFYGLASSEHPKFTDID